ncbi:MAG: hypothetical protein H0U95_02515 [Bacteroidetes bacterium]|nr:hypothetical protein [Bacteroidota bacterium]
MDGFLPRGPQERMDMLGRDKLFLFFIFFIFAKCGETTSNKNYGKDFYQKSILVSEKARYYDVYNKMRDSLDLWVLNKIRRYEAAYTYNYDIDSLICFNTKVDRLISCIHIFGNQFNSTSDDLIWFYGEKINSNWYFFKGADLVLPRSLYQENVKIPLTYQQLHQIALKEVYGGYLKSNGEINEAWFTYHFENVGWCGTCKTTEDFQKSRLENVKTLWLQRDTTQPIKQLPAKINSLP